VPSDYTDNEMDRVINVMRGASVVQMLGCSSEAREAVAGFYGNFCLLVSSKPRLRAELDPFYVMVDFNGNVAPAGFAGHVGATPATLGAVDASGHGTNSIFSFGGVHFFLALALVTLPVFAGAAPCSVASFSCLDSVIFGAGASDTVTGFSTVVVTFLGGLPLLITGFGVSTGSTVSSVGSDGTFSVSLGCFLH
jgi:hypothetical protein